MSKVPGITAKHAIITDACRQRGEDVVFEEAVERLRKEYEQLLEIWPRGDGHKFHVVLSIENANRSNT